MLDVSLGLGITLVNAGVLLTALVPREVPEQRSAVEARHRSLDCEAV
jgi:hypothetical protein